MSGRRRIGVVTGSRADYGILRPLLERIFSDPELEGPKVQEIAVKVAATGVCHSCYAYTQTDSRRLSRHLGEPSTSSLAIEKAVGLQ